MERRTKSHVICCGNVSRVDGIEGAYRSPAVYARCAISDEFIIQRYLPWLTFLRFLPEVFAEGWSGWAAGFREGVLGWMSAAEAAWAEPPEAPFLRDLSEERRAAVFCVASAMVPCSRLAGGGVKASAGSRGGAAFV
jgi:hypothetical protein